MHRVTLKSEFPRVGKISLLINSCAALDGLSRLQSLINQYHCNFNAKFVSVYNRLLESDMPFVISVRLIIPVHVYLFSHITRYLTY